MSSLATPKICNANSAVGVITTTPVPFLGLNLSEYNISMAGIKNANVLPEPVLAAPNTSRPAKSGPMVFAWTVVMLVNPISLMAFKVGSDKPASSNLSLTMSSWFSSTVGAAESASSSTVFSLLFVFFSGSFMPSPNNCATSSNSSSTSSTNFSVLSSDSDSDSDSTSLRRRFLSFPSLDVVTCALLPPDLLLDVLAIFTSVKCSSHQAKNYGA